VPQLGAMFSVFIVWANKGRNKIATGYRGIDSYATDFATFLKMRAFGNSQIRPATRHTSRSMDRPYLVFAEALFDLNRRFCQ